ncbi:MAG TPA: glycosyltransferase family A protein [Blastocatellia bacterium]|nr:glycosyltransferase family A protein [Blastocatellia bacterium]
MIDGLVSTIIPVYNRAVLLREAVASVLSQTYRPIELIVVDDGSTDDTPRVADELGETHPQEVRVIHQSNTGPGLAREAGRQAARGEFIQYLDSDDLLLPEKFDKQVAGLCAHPECGVAYGKTRYRHADGRVEALAWKGSGAKVETMFPAFLMSRWWDTPTPLYRAKVCEQAGPWTDLKLEEDWEYDCRVASLGVRLYYCDEFIVEVRDHNEGRLCEGEASDPARMRERARAHRLILSHALEAGIDRDSPEMQHFARELFLLSRQCGAAGLANESKELFELAIQASGETRGKGWDFKLYGILASIAGWTRVGKMACYTDSIRNER